MSDNMPSARIIKTLIFITYPLVWISEMLTKCFSPKIQPLTVSREEVGAMVDVGTDEGVFDNSENRIIQSFLKISNVCAKEIMTPFVVVSSVRRSTTMKAFHENNALTPYSRIPVYDSKREFITGYVRRTDVLEQLSQDRFDETMDRNGQRTALQRMAWNIPIMNFTALSRRRAAVSTSPAISCTYLRPPAAMRWRIIIMPSPMPKPAPPSH